MHRICITILAIAVVLISTAVLADGPQIYKWVDSQGVVHYSDKAPATQQHVKVITLASLPVVSAQTEAQNQAWIASVHQWYQSIVAQEIAQQYNQIVSWQASQNQAYESSVEPVENASSATQVYAGYSPYYYQHHHHEKYHKHEPAHLPGSSPLFNASLWNTQPNSFSGQLYNTNPNIH